MFRNTSRALLLNLDLLRAGWHQSASRALSIGLCITKTYFFVIREGP